jgi:2,4-dienoyl-CoA reductase-like NADH-dependent reductase (Old Yellow Enzyme family)
VPRALAESDIEAIIEAFGKAAERAVESGFDFVEIHGAHGYLIHSFLAPLSNRRQDHWGGDSLENRMRFALRIAERIRGILPEDMPLFYRASVVDGVDGGVTIDETIALAGELRKRGVDIMDCSSGGISGPSGRALVPPSPGYLVPYAKQVKEAASIPTMAVGLIISMQHKHSVTRIHSRFYRPRTASSFRAAS